MNPIARTDYRRRLERLRGQLDDGELTLDEWERATDQVNSEWEEACERDADDRLERAREQRHD